MDWLFMIGRERRIMALSLLSPFCFREGGVCTAARRNRGFKEAEGFVPFFLVF